MDRYKISIPQDNETLNFEVADYAHHVEDHCKFEVFQDGEFIASFEPDKHKLLHLCKNTGLINEEVLYLIADKLETLQH